MAKYQCVLEGDFDELLRWVDGGIIGGSAVGPATRTAPTMTFRGYGAPSGSMSGTATWLQPVSASVTLVGDGQRIYLTIITSGGSEAVYVKMNTFGEKKLPPSDTGSGGAV